MVTAAIMLAHQVAAKALRDTAFLTEWPATALPLMTVGTAAFTGVLVPIFSKLLVLLSGFWSLIAERFDPAGARASFGRISAAGTAGGIAGSIVAERIASAIAP